MTNLRKILKETPKDLIAAMPRYVYEKRIVVIISLDEAIRAINVIERSKICGIDTETRPSFKKGVIHKVSLLQIATDEICFLFRLNHIGLPPCLINFLENENILKVGLSLKDDFMALRKLAEFTPRAVVDLQQSAKEIGVLDKSLQKLYANFFGMRISKTMRLSNWEADELSEPQLRYAATDAVACLHLYREFSRFNEGEAYEVIENDSIQM